METNSENKMIRYGMIGGSEGSFIGDVHRKAIGLLGNVQLVAGCFDIDRENNIKSGLKYGLEAERIYKDYVEMAEAEAKKQDRLDFVSIVTPNNLHYSIAKEFLLKGFNVVCEKPLCFEMSEAEELKKLAEEKNLLFGMTYTYLGYPMVKQAKQMIREGKIGQINMVMAEFAQDWIADLCARTDGEINLWRNDPKYAGKSSCVGDIGTHIECLVSYITGLEIDSLCANLRSIGKGIKLDSNGEILVRYKGGTSGMYWCSQMAFGNSNGLKVRIFGTKGSIEWVQEDPCKLKFTEFDKPTAELVQGKSYLDSSAKQYCRLPAGHPEGFYEAFSNNYKAYTNALLKKNSGQTLTQEDLDFAGIDEGLKGVRFIDCCVESSRNNISWINI